MVHFVMIYIMNKDSEWEKCNGKVPGKIYISPPLNNRTEAEDWMKIELKRYKNVKGVRIKKAIVPAQDERESIHNYRVMQEIALQ